MSAPLPDDKFAAGILIGLAAAAEIARQQRQHMAAHAIDQYARNVERRAHEREPFDG